MPQVMAKVGMRNHRTLDQSTFPLTKCGPLRVTIGPFYSHRSRAETAERSEVL